MGDKMNSESSNLMNFVELLEKSGFNIRELRVPADSACSQSKVLHQIEINCHATGLRVVMEANDGCQCNSTTKNSGTHLKMLLTPRSVDSPMRINTLLTSHLSYLDQPTEAFKIDTPKPDLECEVFAQPNEYQGKSDEAALQFNFPARLSDADGVAESKENHRTSSPTKSASKLFNDSKLSPIHEDGESINPVLEGNEKNVLPTTKGHDLKMSELPINKVKQAGTSPKLVSTMLKHSDPPKSRYSVTRQNKTSVFATRKSYNNPPLANGCKYRTTTSIQTRVPTKTTTKPNSTSTMESVAINSLSNRARPVPPRNNGNLRSTHQNVASIYVSVAKKQTFQKKPDGCMKHNK